MTARIDALRARMEDAGCDAFFSLSPPANQWLTGFIGTTSAVVVTRTDALFLCDFRYTEQAGDQVAGCDVEEISGSFPLRVGERLKALGVRRAAFDPAVLSIAEHGKIREAYGGELAGEPGVLGPLRAVKDAGEIEALRRASALAESAVADLLPELKPGITEAEFAARMVYEFKRRGARGASFDVIVLFGARSSLPHGQPSERALQPGDAVLLDFGCVLGGYCSDLTRCYAFGSIPGSWFEETYALVRSAQARALEAAKPGMRGRELDAVARDIIEDAGFGAYFGHGLGHGVGIEIHEAPRLNKESDTVLEPGMVITIEPGVYLPGQGGIRIEDLAAVTEDGCDILSTTPKDLRILEA